MQCAVDLSACHKGKIPPPSFLPASFFRFGRRTASVVTNDAAFQERFLKFFSDCLEPPEDRPGQSVVRLEITNSRSSDSVTAEYSEHDGDIETAVLEMLFPETRLTIADCAPANGWRVHASRDRPSQPILAARGGRLILSKQLPWQMMAGHYFIHHVMRLQPEMLFLHGATLAIGGLGLFVGGDKGAGKSTLALALAARGHGFLGDEIGAVHGETGICLPFRRAVSVRVGPQAQPVHDYFAGAKLEHESLPDGSTRTRVSMSEIFPDSPANAVPLACAIFLCGFAERPQVERFDFSRRHLSMLGPLYAMFAGHSIGKRAFALLKLFAGVRCYKVLAGGSPDRTADLIERIVEGKWDIAYRKEPST